METDKKTKRKPRNSVRSWFRADRPNNPYCVQWRVDGKKLTESFDNKVDRDRRCKELIAQAKSNLLGNVPSREEINEYRAFKRAIGDADWRDVVDGWRKHGHTRSVKAEDMYVAYQKWQQERKKAGKLSDSVMNRQLKLAKAFAEDYQGKKAKDITKEGAIDWIEAQYDDAPAPTTFNRALRTLRTMWERSKEPNNLFKEIESWSEGGEIETVRVLPVAEVERLFAYGLTKAPWVMPRIAIEAFMGARFRTAALVSESLINTQDKGITFTPQIIKTKKRQFIQAMEENLWSWMKLATAQTWTMTERQYLTQKSSLFDRSGVPHPHNCFRHSACSYHVAAFQNPGKTALMLCHQGQQRLWDTYKGVATKADGERYYAITPEVITAKLASGEIKLPDTTQAASNPEK
jgi:hypothetical protein